MWQPQKRANWNLHTHIEQWTKRNEHSNQCMHDDDVYIFTFCAKYDTNNRAECKFLSNSFTLWFGIELTASNRSKSLNVSSSPTHPTNYDYCIPCEFRANDENTNHIDNNDDKTIIILYIKFNDANQMKMILKWKTERWTTDDASKWWCIISFNLIKSKCLPLPLTVYVLDRSAQQMQMLAVPRTHHPHPYINNHLLK